MLAAICLQTRQESWSYPDAVAGALFLISGAVFPLAVLPAPLEAMGLLNPVTWWIQGVRTAMLPGRAILDRRGQLAVDGAVTGSAAPDPATITVALFLDRGAGYTRGDTASSDPVSDAHGDRGLLDRTTGS